MLRAKDHPGLANPFSSAVKAPVRSPCEMFSLGARAQSQSTGTHTVAPKRDDDDGDGDGDDVGSVMMEHMLVEMTWMMLAMR